MIADKNPNAAGTDPRRLFVYNGGFLTQPRIRRILQLAGYDIRLGKPSDDDLVGVWGKSPTSSRGEAVARKTGAPVLRVEDAFLRSIHPGRAGEPPIGLHLDRRGMHFCASAPSDLEHLLASHPLDDTALLDRARAAIERIRSGHLSKYNAFLSDARPPDPGYVLVIDQTRGDASVKWGGANAATFKEMLVFAQEENPGARVIIKTHPETLAGHRAGYFGPADESNRVTLFSGSISPWALFEGAIAVYTVSSQMGFESIFAGHRPRVFGQPFYVGWGLCDEQNPVARRHRNLTRAQLFAATMLLYPTWYDPYRDRLCEIEDVLATLEAQTRAWRADRAGYTAVGMRLWKRRPLQKFFGATRKIRFEENGDRAVALAADGDQPVLVWAGKATPALIATASKAQVSLIRVEDGFLRSRGLGAELVAPLSLVCDDLGIYYDPSGESRLERLIAASTDLPSWKKDRADRLLRSLIANRLSKYNLDGAQLPALPEGRRILVPGQVEDDASILKGCGAVATNLALLKRARAENPDATILFKPHPDVESGLRSGALPRLEALEHADLVLDRVDPLAVIDAVDEVWTMTSLLGFEALLRGKSVVVLGAPFYAGWGLTRDLGPVPDRRRARVSLTGLVYAALIDYPRYFDPVTGSPAPVEIVADRLATGDFPAPGGVNRLLSKLQGVLASYAYLWR